MPAVVRIDTDRSCIDEARWPDGAPRVEYLLADFLSHPFPPESSPKVWPALWRYAIVWAKPAG